MAHTPSLLPPQPIWEPSKCAGQSGSNFRLNNKSVKHKRDAWLSRETFARAFNLGAKLARTRGNQCARKSAGLGVMCAVKKGARESPRFTSSILQKQRDLYLGPHSFCREVQKVAARFIHPSVYIPCRFDVYIYIICS